MTFNTKTIGIVVALVVSTGLIGGAYVFSGPYGPFSATANAQSTAELLKAYAAKDTDNDGLPDWEETLYGTDPNNAHSVSQTLTDGQAVAQGLVKPKFTSAVATSTTATAAKNAAATVPGVLAAPGTVTDQFAKTFFQSYMTASGGQRLSSDQQQALLTQLLGTFSQQARSLFLSTYTTQSLHLSDNVTLSVYAASLQRIFAKDDVAPGQADPISLMQALIQNNDETARTQLNTLAQTYAQLAKDLAATTAPSQLASQHLALIQAFDSLGKATDAVAHYEKDPVAVLGALSYYQPSAQMVMTSFNDIANSISANGTPAPGDPQAFVLNVAHIAQ